MAAPTPHAAAEPTGLRDRKAAATRAAIGDALAERLKSRRLAEITVDELAHAAQVSRQTFFNYFATKEFALDFIYARWLFEGQATAREAGLRGVDEIVHLFEAIGRRVNESPLRAREVLMWFAGRPLGLPQPSLSAADRERLSPAQAHEPLRPLRDQLLGAVAEARRAGQLTATGSDYQMAHLLGVLLCGGTIVGHSTPDQNWEALYRHHALHALGVAKRGGARTRPAPRTKPGKTNHRRKRT